jgi:hypothetical protein
MSGAAGVGAAGGGATPRQDEKSSLLAEGGTPQQSPRDAEAEGAGAGAGAEGSKLSLLQAAKPVGAAGSQLSATTATTTVNPPFKSSSSAGSGQALAQVPFGNVDAAEYTVTASDLIFKTGKFVRGNITVDGVNFTVDDNGMIKKEPKQSTWFGGGGGTKKTRKNNNQFHYLLEKLMKEK